jgi:AcrR family transcriptional regulator
MQLKKIVNLPRKRPSQARSEMMVDLILESASRVLERNALAGYNTTAVAERAGVSIGSIYQYFPNRDALTAELILRMHRQLIDGLRGALEETRGLSLEAALPALIRAGMPTNLKLARVLECEEERLPRSEELLALEREIEASVIQFIRRYAARQTPDEALEVAAIDMVSIVRGMTDSTINRHGNMEDLTDRIILALLGYLTPLLSSGRRKP